MFMRLLKNHISKKLFVLGGVALNAPDDEIVNKEDHVLKSDLLSEEKRIAFNNFMDSSNSVDLKSLYQEGIGFIEIKDEEGIYVTQVTRKANDLTMFVDNFASDLITQISKKSIPSNFFYILLNVGKCKGCELFSKLRHLFFVDSKNIVINSQTNEVWKCVEEEGGLMRLVSESKNQNSEKEFMWQDQKVRLQIHRDQNNLDRSYCTLELLES